MLESMPRATRSTPTPPADAAPTEAGVARDLAQNQILPDCGEFIICGPKYPFICFTRGAASARASPGVAVGRAWECVEQVWLEPARIYPQDAFSPRYEGDLAPSLVLMYTRYRFTIVVCVDNSQHAKLSINHSIDRTHNRRICIPGIPLYCCNINFSAALSIRMVPQSGYS